MEDERGLYYYPSPGNQQMRMYVKEAEGVVWFRMWSSADPRLWELHDWVPYAAILRASEMYDGKKFDPRRAYDIEAARALLHEGK